MNFEERKEIYKAKKAVAVAERAKLERMRMAFTEQCARTESAEIVASNFKKDIIYAFMKQEGLDP